MYAQISDYSSEHKIVIFQSVLGECAKWAKLSNWGPVAAKTPQTPFLNSKVTEPIFTNFLHTVDTLMPLLMHVFPEQLCIPFQNARVKSESCQYRHLQKGLKLIGYYSNVPSATAKIMRVL